MANYYVSPSGSDRNGDGSLGSPWKTILKGANALNDNDTLYLRGGTYTEQNTVILRKENTTVSAYNNERPIWDVKREFPSNTNGNIPFTAILQLEGNGTLANGIEIRNSRGRSFLVNGNNCTVKKCTSRWNGRHGIHVEGNDCLLEDCLIMDASQLTDSGGHIQFRYASGGIAKGCIATGGGGQGIIFIQCYNATAINNIVYDVKAAHIYFDGVDTGIMDSNVVFRTDQSKYPPGNMLIISQELYDDRNVKTKDITVTNNLAVGGDHCFNFPVGSDRDSLGDGVVRPVPNAGFKNCKVVNNVFINGHISTVRIYDHKETDVSEHTPCWFANNIVIQDDSNAKIFAYRSASTLAEWTFMNNLYSRTPDSDVRGSGDIIGPAGLVNHQKNLNQPSDFDIENYKLKETSQAIDAATRNLPITVDKDFFGEARGSRPDMGFHEFMKELFINAGFSARPRSGTAPLEVYFTNDSSSSNPITSYFWDFGDGAISTEKDPVHEYQAGQFTVSLRVLSAAGSDILTERDLIDVEPLENNTPARVVDGLSAFYRFDEGAGDTIFDVSGAASPLNLKISDSSAVKWLNPGIEITKPTIIASSNPATALTALCQESNALTVEVWMEPQSLRQNGPARIVSLSKNNYSRNLTVGQGLWGTQPSDLFDLRLRTTERSANGMPSFSSPAGSAKGGKTHLVITHNKNGRTRIYIDKFIVAETVIPGDFSTWNPRFPLLLANEATGDNPWLGSIYLLAIYQRELTSSEIIQNYSAGTALTAPAETSVVSTTDFKRFLLITNGSGRAAVKTTAVGFGVQYPDMRCVLCANGHVASMAVYPDINAVIRTYNKQGLKVDWLD